jgi:hypothetical protein
MLAVLEIAVKDAAEREDRNRKSGSGSSGRQREREAGERADAPPDHPSQHSSKTFAARMFYLDNNYLG